MSNNRDSIKFLLDGETKKKLKALSVITSKSMQDIFEQAAKTQVMEELQSEAKVHFDD